MSNIKDFNQSIEELAFELIPEVASRAPKPCRIHDPIWGSIAFESYEIELINTPLLQRLRRIRQLGGVYMVFPGALHSRFEHTLGVAHQVSKMCSALKNSGIGISKKEIDSLRFAALCHDTGHGPFSHISELFFQHLEPFTSEKISGAAEYLSMQLVKSKAMKKFVDSINEKYKVEIDLELAANVIRGELPKEKAYLGEIVHGPFDTDKIDYLMRDGKYCGIPLSIDSEQIYSSMILHEKDGAKHLAGDIRAAAALMQLIHHRQHMFTVVYHHKVARSFTAMLNNAFECICNENSTVNGYQLNNPANFLHLDDEMLLIPSLVNSAKGKRLLLDIRERRLFKVAYKFSNTHDEALLDTLSEKCDEIAKIAGIDRELVAIDKARRSSNSGVLNTLIDKDGEVFTLGDHMKLEKEGEAIHNFFEEHLVLCPAEHVDAVKKATKAITKNLI